MEEIAQSNKAPIGSGLGNTINRPSASKKWCFTYNNYSKEDITILEKEFGSKGSFFFGEEFAPTTGTPHLQGYVEFKEKCRPAETYRKYGMHWEKAKGSMEDNMIYCRKAEYEKGLHGWEGCRIHTNFRQYVPDPFYNKKLYPWQERVLKIVEEKPDDRTIYWFWDSEGCSGKTTLAKHICLKYKAVYVSGKANDVKAGLAELSEPVDIVIFGFPRSVEDYVSYDAIEAVKDGIFFSGKYKSKMCLFNCPHVVIFANFPPDKRKLSQDRWKVINIRERIAADAAGLMAVSMAQAQVEDVDLSEAFSDDD